MGVGVPGRRRNGREYLRRGAGRVVVELEGASLHTEQESLGPLERAWQANTWPCNGGVAVVKGLDAFPDGWGLVPGRWGNGGNGSNVGVLGGNGVGGGGGVSTWEMG